MTPFLNFVMTLWIVLCDVIRCLCFALVPTGLLPKRSIKGQVALVTGGGNGLGRLLAVRLAKEGAGIVVLWDLDEAAMAETCTLVENTGHCKAAAFRCDVGDPESVRKTAARVKDEIGVVSILVNNAGIAAGDWILEASQAAIQKVFQVNTLAHYWTVRAFLPDMLKENRGLIMAVASTAGLHGLLKAAEYSGSKFAIIGFMESLQMELTERGCSGVGLTVVCPNFSHTGMFTCKWDGLIPLQDPEFVAEKAVEALLLGKERVTVPWIYGPGSALLRLVCGLQGQAALGILLMGRRALDSLRLTRPAGSS